MATEIFLLWHLGFFGTLSLCTCESIPGLRNHCPFCSTGSFIALELYIESDFQGTFDRYFKSLGYITNYVNFMGMSLSYGPLDLVA